MLESEASSSDRVLACPDARGLLPAASFTIGLTGTSNALPFEPAWRLAPKRRLIEEHSSKAGSRRPPVIVTQPVTSAIVVTTYTQQIVAGDPQGQSISYSLVRYPGGMTIGHTTHGSRRSSQRDALAPIAKKGEPGV